MVRICLLEPFAEQGQSFMGPGDDLVANNLADLGACSRAGIGGGFNGGDIAAEETSDITAADFFPADERDVGRFESGVAGLEQGAQAFAFDHSNCLLSHEFS